MVVIVLWICGYYAVNCGPDVINGNQGKALGEGISQLGDGHIYPPRSYLFDEEQIVDPNGHCQVPRAHRTIKLWDIPPPKRAVVRGAPWGDEPWQRQAVEQLGLETTLGPRGRPGKTAPSR
jgi:hypothetical protein